MAGPKRRPVRSSKKLSASQQRGQLNRMAAKRGASAGRRAASKASKAKGTYARMRSRRK